MAALVVVAAALAAHTAGADTAVNLRAVTAALGMFVLSGHKENHNEMGKS